MYQRSLYSTRYLTRYYIYPWSLFNFINPKAINLYKTQLLIAFERVLIHSTSESFRAWNSRETSSFWAHSSCVGGSRYRKSVSFVRSGLVIGLQELVNKHKSASNLDHKFSIEHSRRDLLIVKLVVSVAKGGHWGRIWSPIQVLCHHLIESVSRNGHIGVSLPQFSFILCSILRCKLLIMF